MTATTTTICCPGSPAIDLAWTPCTASTPLDAIAGYTGLQTRTRGDRCPIARLTWTTQCWTHDNYPSMGDRVAVNGQDYFVDSAVYYGCTVVLGLCRPILECPDCTSTIFRLAREDGTTELCEDDLVGNAIANSVPTTVCITEQIRRVVDNAEIQIVTARICLDTLSAVQVGDLVVCGIDVWRIERIESECSSSCLLTLIAIKEPWKIYEAVSPAEPDNYIGQADLDISGVRLVAEGVAGFPVTDATAELHLTLPTIEIDAVSIFVPEYHGIADLGIPAATLDGTGSALPTLTGTADLDVSGVIFVMLGRFIPAAQGEADLAISGAQLEVLGTVDLPPVPYSGSGDLGLVTVEIDEQAYFIEIAAGEAELAIPAASLTATGIVDVPFVYSGTADECPPWDTFAGEALETFAGETIEFTHDCGFQVAGLNLQATGTFTWGYAGEAMLTTAGAQLSATGVTSVSEQFIGSGDVDLPAADMTALGQYSLSPQYIGAPGACGPWTTDLDEIITDENDIEIEFADRCEFVLPSASLTASGTFAVDAISGSAALQTSCALTAGFVTVSPAPATVYTGTVDSLDVSGARVDALGDYTDPVLPPQMYTGTAEFDISAADITLFEGTITGTQQVIVGMLGGDYIDYGVAPSVKYPLTDSAVWRWDNVVSTIDDRNAMLLSTPLAMSQGAPTTSAVLVLHGDFFGFGADAMEGTITAWDVDNAPAVDQGWSPEDVLALPRTTASVDLSLLPPTTSFVVEVDITSIVNEIILRPGWTSGNRIMLLLETNDKMELGDKEAIFDTEDPPNTTRIVIAPPVLKDAPWVRANYWYFENIEAGCTQGSADPLLTANATEMILRTQDSCGPTKVRRWALGLAVRDLDETVNVARIRLDTTALAAGAVPYNTTSVTAYYELSSFTEGTYTSDIVRTNLQPAGGMQISWHWSYGENAYVIEGFGPLLQAAQQDPAYVLGQPFRIVLVPDDMANWNDDPAHPIQGHQVNTATPQLQYYQAGNSTTPLTQPSWLDETEDYPEPKIGLGYDANTYETILNIDNPINVSTSAGLATAVATAKANTAINAILLAPGVTYSWPNHLLNGLNRDPQSVDPLVIMTAPGSSTQAKLQGPNGYVNEERAIRGVCFVDLDLTNELRLHGQNGMRDILIERCTGSLDIQGERVFGQTIPGTNLTLPGTPIKNVIVRLNNLSDHWAPNGGLYHGMFGYNIESLLMEGNIIDHNGWSDTVGRDAPDNLGGASTHKHNVYINPAYPPFSSRNIVIRYNWISRASSHGIHGKVGANVYRNLFVKNPIACQQGFGGDEQFTAFGVRQDPVFRDNVCVAAADIDSTNPRGVGLWTTCVDNLEFRDNLFLDNGTSSSNNETYLLEQDFPIEIAMSNNRSVNWPSQLPNRGTPNFTPVIVENIGNDYSGNSLSPTAQALADSLKLDANIEALKAARHRRGVDINQLRADMATLQAGVS